MQKRGSFFVSLSECTTLSKCSCGQTHTHTLETGGALGEQAERGRERGREQELAIAASTKWSSDSSVAIGSKWQLVRCHWRAQSFSQQLPVSSILPYPFCMAVRVRARVCR